MDKFRIPSIEEYAQAEAKGISRKIVNQRLWYGWDTDRALTRPVNAHRIPQELKNQLKRMGISQRTYDNRLRMGWSKERARTEPVKRIGRGASR